MRVRRRALSDSTVKSHSAKVNSHLINTVGTQVNQTVFCYLCQEQEIGLGDFIKHAWDNGCSVCVPVVEDGSMQFVEISPGSQLRSSSFGIQEPITGQHISVKDADLAVVPLVAFSSTGARLGRGGGFYDRAFAQGSGPTLIGVAHEFQKSDEFQTYSWDQGLDAVVTEAGWYVFTKKGEQLQLPKG